MGRKDPVTIRKALFKIPSMRRVSALRHQTGAQYSAVEQAKDRAAARNALALAPHSEPASCLSSVTQIHIFFAQCLEMVAEREWSAQFYPEVG